MGILILIINVSLKNGNSFSFFPNSFPLEWKKLFPHILLISI